MASNMINCCDKDGAYERLCPPNSFVYYEKNQSNGYGVWSYKAQHSGWLAYLQECGHIVKSKISLLFLPKLYTPWLKRKPNHNWAKRGTTSTGLYDYNASCYFTNFVWNMKLSWQFVTSDCFTKLGPVYFLTISYCIGSTDCTHLIS